MDELNSKLDTYEFIIKVITTDSFKEFFSLNQALLNTTQDFFEKAKKMSNAFTRSGDSEYYCKLLLAYLYEINACIKGVAANG